VEREIELPAGPDAVWDSLPSLLGDEVELVTEPGGRVRARGPEGDRVGTVEEADAPHRLTFWWMPVDGDDAPSFVELELAGSGVGTLLRVRETRFDASTAVEGLLRGPLARAHA
jgi:uncharacterized protein YndB with AHSA1/START domain